MDNQVIERFSCMQSSFALPAALFLISSLALTWYIAKQNSFGVKDAILVVVGLKKFPRTWKINLWHVATLIIPMVCFFFLIRDCP